jgi:hypothetical protein
MKGRDPAPEMLVRLYDLCALFTPIALPFEKV